ncbi:CrcB protein [Terracoccus luteus]|uniref:Fluoride-specific ion channel FluC n=1 Tax=Terracoccus luteus TaxID=53356 RepID=A0A495XTN6_9MICO|nr:CrcB family protein [Terracoccus luteus]RKT77890.1 CrcB protein [Terracoccus luteus]
MGARQRLAPPADPGFAPLSRTGPSALPAAAPSRKGGSLLVLAGGTAGTLARYGVEQSLPAGEGMPWGTLTVNLTGALVLGLFLGAMAARGAETPARRATRLALGTGVLGGYTTYSTFAVETDRLVRDGWPALALAYVVVSLVAGVVAALVGLRLGGRTAPTSGGSAAPVDPDGDSTATPRAAPEPTSDDGRDR